MQVSWLPGLGRGMVFFDAEEVEVHTLESTVRVHLRLPSGKNLTLAQGDVRFNAEGHLYSYRLGLPKEHIYSAGKVAEKPPVSGPDVSKEERAEASASPGPVRKLPSRPFGPVLAGAVPEGEFVSDDQLQRTLIAHAGSDKSEIQKQLVKAYTELGRIRSLREYARKTDLNMEDGGVVHNVLNSLASDEMAARKSITRFGKIGQWMVDNNLEKVEWSA